MTRKLNGLPTRLRRASSSLRRRGGIAKVAGLAIACGLLASTAAAQSNGGPSSIQHNGEVFRVVPAAAMSGNRAPETPATSSAKNRTAGSGATVRADGGNQPQSKRTRSVTPIAAAIEDGSAESIQPVGFLGDMIHRRRGKSSAGYGSCDGCGSMGCQDCGHAGICSACGGGGCNLCGGGGMRPQYAVGMYTGGGCNGSCGGTCNGQCGGCGSGGGCECSYGPTRMFCNTEFGHYNGPICDPYFNPCISCSTPCGSAPCMPYTYTIAEGLYFGRSSDSSIDYDMEPGVRLGFGKIPNCATGCEVIFTGLGRFEERDSKILPRSPIIADVLAGTFKSQFYSVEMNKVRMSKDVFKLLCGLKYIQFDEKFDGTLTDGDPAVDPADRINFGNVDVDNQLFGGHIGADLYYPISAKATLEGRGRAGAYVNFGEFEADLTRSPARFEDDDEDLAGFFEFGLGARYAASRRLSVYARGEMWYLTGIATVQQETTDAISQGFLNDVDLDDDVFFYGVSGGFELKY